MTKRYQGDEAPDLSDDDLGAVEYHACSSGVPTPQLVKDSILAMVRELRRRRAFDRVNLASWEPKAAPCLMSTVPAIDGHPCGVEFRSYDREPFTSELAVITSARMPDRSVFRSGVLVGKYSINSMIEALTLHGRNR